MHLVCPRGTASKLIFSSFFITIPGNLQGLAPEEQGAKDSTDMSIPAAL